MSSMGKVISISKTGVTKTTTKKLFARSMSPAKFKKFKENSEWLAQNRDELRKKFANMYVAIHEKHVCKSEKTLSQLLEYVKDHYGHDEDVVIEYINKEKPKLIL